MLRTSDTITQFITQSCIINCVRRNYSNQIILRKTYNFIAVVFFIKPTWRLSVVRNMLWLLTAFLPLGIRIEHQEIINISLLINVTRNLAQQILLWKLLNTKIVSSKLKLHELLYVTLILHQVIGQQSLNFQKCFSLCCTKTN